MDGYIKNRASRASPTIAVKIIQFNSLGQRKKDRLYC
jgi:hypothetical protein